MEGRHRNHVNDVMRRDQALRARLQNLILPERFGGQGGYVGGPITNPFVDMLEAREGAWVAY
jgi:hypothetical protein